MSDGKKRFEIYAGDGYLSQSPAQLHIPKSWLKESTSVTVRWPDGAESKPELIADDSPVIKILQVR
jgi:hypothetical protein